MTNGKDLVTPYAWKMGADGKTPVINDDTNALTKREYFAAMAMQGILANPVHSQKWTFTFWQRLKAMFGLKVTITSTIGTENTKLAVKQADALIKALNQQL